MSSTIHPQTSSMKNLSIILPVKNEEAHLKTLLPDLCTRFPAAEIIIVNDGSSDESEKICGQYDVKVVSHPYSIGNGAAIKTGARHATGDILVFMDADNQHKPKDISLLLNKLSEGYDMVVGARSASSQAGIGRLCANTFFNHMASWMTNQKVADLTSGFRAVKADKFREFIHLLPNGFSYPTTITMSFFRSGYTISYITIETEKRIGRSHIRPFHDAIKFVLIIFKVGTLYSPLKLFFPISMAFFILGCTYYLYTYITFSRFTNMSALLFITAILVFLIGLVSEQVTGLLYSRTKNN